MGKPIRSDGRLLNSLIELKYIPVVACVAGDRQGHFFNVNADQMAVSVAGALRVDKLTIAGLEATVGLYLRGDLSAVPALRMVYAQKEEIAKVKFAAKPRTRAAAYYYRLDLREIAFLIIREAKIELLARPDNFASRWALPVSACSFTSMERTIQVYPAPSIRNCSIYCLL